jgi:hypothetical protein
MNGLCSVSVNNDSRGVKRVCRVSVPVEAMKAMRFVIGDRVQVSGDTDSRQLLIARVVSGGSCCLCPQNGTTPEHAGEVTVATMQFTAQAWLLAILPASLRRCRWEATTEGLVLFLAD